MATPLSPVGQWSKMGVRRIFEGVEGRPWVLAANSPCLPGHKEKVLAVGFGKGERRHRWTFMDKRFQRDLYGSTGSGIREKTECEASPWGHVALLAMFRECARGPCVGFAPVGEAGGLEASYE